MKDLYIYTMDICIDVFPVFDLLPFLWDLTLIFLLEASSAQHLFC